MNQHGGALPRLLLLWTTVRPSGPPEPARKAAPDREVGGRSWASVHVQLPSSGDCVSTVEVICAWYATRVTSTLFDRIMPTPVSTIARLKLAITTRTLAPLAAIDCRESCRGQSRCTASSFDRWAYPI